MPGSRSERAAPQELEPLGDEELEALPIFPLPRVVLLPGGLLPLHVFEPRYRAMIRDCLAEGPRALAMAMLEPGWERAYQQRPPIRRVAGAGRIVAHRANQDGTYDLVLRGLSRVRLDERTELDRPYRVARASLLEDRDGEDEPALRRALEPLLLTSSSLAALEQARGRQTGAPIEAGDAPAAIVDRIADRWIHDAATRQVVLETTSVPERMARVGESLVTLLARVSASTDEGSGALN